MRKFEDPAFPESLLETISDIRNGKVKWSKYSDGNSFQ